MIDEVVFKESRILVADADAEMVDRVRSVLDTAEFRHIQTVSDLNETVDSMDSFGPDLIILGLEAKDRGLEVLRAVRKKAPRDVSLPILAVTGETDPTIKRTVFMEGANEYLPKPIDPTDLLARVRTLLEIRLLSLQLSGGSRLDELVDAAARQRTKAHEEVEEELLNRLAAVAEYRESGAHPEGVGLMAEMLARVMGFPEDQAKLVGRAALLHDVGKVAVPEEIWGKPGRLTPSEFERVKVHAQAGAEILREGRTPLLWLAEQIARYHHERWDGTGYFGLAGEEIPLAARIVAVADAYDALTHDRPYRKALSADEATEEIKRERGHQFDPQVVDAFLGIQAS